MSFSVGVLYSTQSLLQIVHRGGLEVSNFATSFSRIEVADGNAVLALSQKCRWLRIERNGTIELTERGNFLRDIADPRACLREQLFDVIVAELPPWSRKLMYGRFEALKAMPDAARQCFSECELAEGFDEATVHWWDRAATSSRSERTRVNHEIGRCAEKLSLKFERTRTGADPFWQSVETSVAGFDVLSVTERDATAKLMIEVKGSSQHRNEASFYLSRNEWNTARHSKAYYFHLWLVHTVPILFVVPADELAPHVPTDGLSGHWETAQLFYRDFPQCEHGEYVCE